MKRINRARPQACFKSQHKQTTTTTSNTKKLLLSMAGIKINQEVVDQFNQLKFSNKLPFFTCKLSQDLSEVVVDHMAESGASWTELETCLPDDDCRYAVFNFHYEQEGSKR